MSEQEYLSTDGQLRLLVVAPDGDITIGFDGCPSHTHGDILAGHYGCDEQQGVQQFVSSILEGRYVIAIWRTPDGVRDIWLPEHEGSNLGKVVAELARYGDAGETVEFRLWDGTKIEAPAGR